MITTLRIDERLIHGQVIATWLKSLGVTHLIVANDAAAGNETQQKLLKLAVPSSVKCLIKSVSDVKRIVNDPRCESMRIMLIAGNPTDAYELLQDVPAINDVNLANYGTITKPDGKNKLTLSNMVYLDQEDVEAVNRIIAFGKPVFTQKTPLEPKKSLSKKL